MKGYVLFTLGVIYGTVLSMWMQDLMPLWLMITTSIAVTIACICVDSK